MRRALHAAALATAILTLTACDAINKLRGYTPDSITITITGVPNDMTPDVTITGPGGYRREVTETTTLDGLAPGAYTVTAATIAFRDNPLDPDAHTKTLTLDAGGAQSVQVAYAPHRQYALAATAHLNQLRAEAGVPPVKLDADNSTPNWLHARYLVENSTWGHEEDPGKPFYTPEGHAAGKRSNIGSPGSGYDFEPYDHPENAANTFLTAPFHLFHLLNPSATGTRIAIYRTSTCFAAQDCPNPWTSGAAAVEMISGRAWPEGKTVRFPENGQVVPVIRHAGEYPSPVTACPRYDWPVGLPILAMHGRGNLPAIKSTRLTRGDEVLEHCTFTAATYTNPDPAAQSLARNLLDAFGAAIIIPREPLAPSSTYTVTVEYATHTDTWSFHTAHEDELLFK